MLAVRRGRCQPVLRHLGTSTAAHGTIDVGTAQPPAASERGPKDTVDAPPGQVTRFKAFFDKKGTYVWHCHILEHEDNEMMRNYRGPLTWNRNPGPLTWNRSAGSTHLDQTRRGPLGHPEGPVPCAERAPVSREPPGLSGLRWRRRPRMPRR